MNPGGLLTIVGPERDKGLVAQVGYSAALAKALGISLAIAYVFDDQLEHYGYVDPLATDKDKEAFVEHIKSNNRALASRVLEDIKEELHNLHQLDYSVFEVPLSRREDVIKALLDLYEIDLTIISKRLLRPVFFSKKMMVPSWVCSLNSRLLLFEP